MAADFDLNRFIEAQAGGVYEKALGEIRAGRKTSHWIWYIFPQLKGLGFSYNATYYGIVSREEAVAYLAQPVLGNRLVEITQALLAHKELSAYQILGGIDAQKVLSCMTLFDAVATDKRLFRDVIQQYYGGKCDVKTLRLLSAVCK